MSLEYREYAPAPALATMVRCYWAIRGDPAAEHALVNRVMPDSCMDVIFDLRAPLEARARVIGTMLKASERTVAPTE